MPEFALKDEGLVRSAELAAMVARAEGMRLGKKGTDLDAYIREHAVTTQTIRNYCDSGVVTPARTDARGQRLFDPDAAVKAILENRPERKQGGKRRGAGRKRASPKPEKAFRQAADARRVIAQAKQRAADETRPDRAVRVSEVLTMTRDELVVLFGAVGPDESGLSTAAIDRLNSILDTQIKARKIDLEAGKLVEADSALKAWSDKQRAVKAQVDALPLRVAERLAGVAWVSPETVDRLTAELHAMGLEGPGLDLVRLTLAPPPELAARLRAVVADEVRSVGERVAGGEE